MVFGKESVFLAYVSKVFSDNGGLDFGQCFDKGYGAVSVRFFIGGSAWLADDDLVDVAKFEWLVIESAYGRVYSGQNW